MQRWTDTATTLCNAPAPKAPDGFDTALVLVGGDKVQSTLSLVRQGGIIAFPDGVMPEPESARWGGTQEGRWLRQPDVVRSTQPIRSSIGDFQVHIAQTFALEEGGTSAESDETALSGQNRVARER